MAKRASLASFTPQPVQPQAESTAAQPAPVLPASEPKAEAAPIPSRRKYPHVSVYLPENVIRTLKLVAIEQNTRVNELCAQAITAWLEANGHLRGKRFKV